MKISFCVLNAVRLNGLTSLRFLQNQNIFTQHNNYHTYDEKLSKRSYWKKRYKNRNTGNKIFDWFLDADEIIEPIINNVSQIQAEPSIPLQYLDVGCGLSDLSIHLLTKSLEPVSITLVDFVSEALLFQSRRITECRRMMQLSPESTQHLVCADVIHLPFRDESFDVVIDKGTMDALLKDKVHGRFKSHLLISEVTRLLTQRGRYIQVSDEDPDSRLLLLDTFSTDLNLNFRPNEKEDIHSEVRPNVSNSQKGHLEKTHRLSSWKFETITSKSGSEYFLYWAEKLCA